MEVFLHTFQTHKSANASSLLVIYEELIELSQYLVNNSSTFQ